MAHATRPYAGRTAEQRRAKRRRKLMGAAMDLLSSEGSDAVTVRGLCARAQLNDRYFYESFRDRDELLSAVLDEAATEGVQHVLASLQGAGGHPRDRVRVVVDAGFDYLTEDPRRGAVVIESQATEELRRRRHDIVRMLADLMVEQGREILGDQAPDEQDARLTALTLVNGIMELLATWLRGELDVSREHLADFLVAMILTAADISTALTRETRS